MKRARVAFVTDKVAPHFVGGYEVRVFELARRLAKDYDVDILSSSRPSLGHEPFRFEKIFPAVFQNFPTGERSLANTLIFGIYSLLRYPRFRRYDALIVESIPYIHLPSILALTRRTGVLRILDVSEAWGEYSASGSRRERLERRLARMFLMYGVKRSDLVLAISGATKRSLSRSFGASEKRVHVVHCGVDLGRPLGAPALTTSQERVIDFITVSRLVTHKRVVDFVKALSLLKQAYGWSGSAVVVGDGPLKGDLISTAVELGVGDSVEFVGFVSPERKSELLMKSKTFVMTSEREGFSIASLEALAHGLPVVVGKPASDDVFGPGDFVVEGITGYHYPVGDSSALAGRLDEALHDRRSGKINESYLLNMCASFSWDAAAQKLAELIDQAIALRKTRA